MSRRRGGGKVGGKLPMLFTIDTTQSGTPPTQFQLPFRDTFTYALKAEWGDGNSDDITSWNQAETLHTYDTGGIYQPSLTGKCGAFIFAFSGDRRKFISLDQWGDVDFEEGGLGSAWNGCLNAVSFASPIPFYNVTSLFATWQFCTGITTAPDVNALVNVTSLQQTWQGCTGIVTPPDVSALINATNLIATWQGCTGITTASDVSALINATTFQSTWNGCTGLTTVLPNQFDNCTATNFLDTYTNTNLTQTSIDNVVVSINSNGTSGGVFTQTGGSAPSAIGEAAITAMRSRGWTVTVTGGF